MTGGGAIKSTAGALPAGPAKLWRTVRTSCSTATPISTAGTAKRALRSLVPSMIATRSSGRWLSSATGRCARPFLCTPAIGSGCTVVRPGSPSSITRQGGPSRAASTPGQRAAGARRRASSRVAIGIVPWVLELP